MTKPRPSIVTLSDWFHAVERGDKIVSMPVPKGSGSLAQRIREGKGDTTSGYPEVYKAHDEAARLIEQRFGVWVTEDSGVIAKAARTVANYLDCPTNDVWGMEFVKFRDVLKQAILAEAVDRAEGTQALAKSLMAEGTQTVAKSLTESTSNKGGRRPDPDLEALWKVYEEVKKKTSDASDQDVLDEYHRRFAAPIKARKRDKLTCRQLRDLRSRKKKKDEA